MATFSNIIQCVSRTVWLAIFSLGLWACGPGTGGTGPGPGPSPTGTLSSAPTALSSLTDERQRLLGNWSNASSSVKLAFENNRIVVLQDCRLFEFSAWEVLNGKILASTSEGLKLEAILNDANLSISFNITEQTSGALQPVVSALDLKKEALPNMALSKPSTCP
jgi:hypothetical protein